MPNFDLKSYQPFALAGVVAGGSAWLLAQALQFFKPITVTFATVDVRSKLAEGFGSGLGDKIFGLIGGLQVPNIIVMIASVVAITLLGAFIAGLFSPFAKANMVWRWAWVFFTGSFVVTAILGVISGSSIGNVLRAAILPPGLIVLAIFSVIVAVVVNFAYNNFPPLTRQRPALP